MVTCPNCNKQFKTLTKSHKDKCAREMIQRLAVAEELKQEDAQSQFVQENSFDDAVTEFANSFTSGAISNILNNLEIDDLQDKSAQQANKCDFGCQVDESELKSQSKQIQARISQRGRQQFVHNQMILKKLNAIPHTQLVDLTLYKNEALYTLTSENMAIGDILLKEYNTPVFNLQKRVQPMIDNLQFELKNLKDYAEQKQRYDAVEYEKKMLEELNNYKFLNLMSAKNQREIINKFIVENNITFSSKNLAPILIFYDIETCCKLLKIPEVHDQDSFISMIGSVFIQPNGKRPYYKLYILDSYSLDQSVIEEHIKKHSNIKEFNLKIKRCISQQDMCVKFLNDIGKIKQLNFLIGFNSSSGSVPKFDKNKPIEEAQKEFKKKTCGYDIPWILERSQIKYTATYKYGVKIFGKIDNKQIQQVDILPRTYILDAQVLFYSSLSPNEKKKIENFKLDSYLSMWKITKKIEMNHKQLQQTLLQFNSNVNEISAYCLYDCICLWKAFVDKQILEKKYSMMDMLNVPLQYVLYQTDVTCITMKLQRNYFENGYMFMFDKIKQGQKHLEYIGATTQEADDQIQIEVVENVGMGDYQSLYPSAGVAYNISPETCLDEPTQGCHEFNLNYQDMYKEQTKEPEMAYYANQSVKQGLIAKYQAELLQLRLDVKNQIKTLQLKLDKTQNKDQQTKLKRQIQDADLYQYNIKILINSMYGMQGDCKSPFFDHRCARGITAIGRKACDIARKVIEAKDLGRITFRDTDSCAFIVKDVLNLPIKWLELKEEIKREMGYNNFEFQFEGDEFGIRVLYPRQKKSYCRLQAKFDAIKKADFNIDKDTELVIKGLQWSLYTTYCKQQNEAIFREILKLQPLDLEKINKQPDMQGLTKKQIIKMKNNLIRGDIQDIIKKFEQTHAKRIKKAIEEKDINVMMSYAKYLKYSSRDKKCQYLENNYMIHENCYIIPYQNGSKMKNENIIPVEKLKEDEQNRGYFELIDVERTLEFFLQPVRKFFGLELDSYSDYIDQEIDVDQTVVNYCYMQGNKPVHHKMVINYDDIETFVKNNKQFSVHEVLVKEVNKMYFDIDTNTKVNINNLVVCLRNTIARLTTEIDINPTIHVATASNKDKDSFHIVVDVLCDRRTNQYIAQAINKQMNIGKFCDLGVYSNNHCMRLPCTNKITKEKGVEFRQFKIVSKSMYKDFIIGDTAYVTHKIPKCILFDNELPIDVYSQRFELDDKYKRLISEFIINNSKISMNNIQMKQKQNFVNIIVEGSYQCPICDKTHENDNLFARLLKSGVSINCFSNKERTSDKDKKQAKRITFSDYEQQDKCEQIPNIIKNTPKEEEFLKAEQLNMKHINFQIDKDVTYIKSYLGTGKSYHLERLLKQNKQNYILCLSFRRTFSTAFAKQFGLIDYQDLRGGELSLLNTPKLMIQVDSLTRYIDSVDPDLLIIDEIESVLSQLVSIRRYNTSVIIDNYIKLIRNSKKVVIMDGLLEQKTIDNINHIRQTNNYKIYQNKFSPRSDYKFDIKKFSNTSTSQKSQIIDTFVGKMKEGKKIYGMITSQTLMEEIKKAIETKTDKKVMIYHGIDAKVDESTIDENNKGISHANIKKEHFKNVNEYWILYDCVLHSSTVTAGISFDIVHFDEQINVFASKTCSSLDFFQGIHRCRHLKNKYILTYFDHVQETDFYTPLQLVSMERQLDSKFAKQNINLDLTLNNQVMIWLKSRQGAFNQFRTEILIKYIVSMGYQLEYTGSLETRKDVTAFENKTAQRIQSVEITEEDKHLIKYMKKQKFVDNISDPDIVYKYKKVKLANLYELSCQQINAMDLKQIKELLDGQQTRKLINQIHYLFPNGIDNQNVENVIKEIKQRYNYDKMAQQLGSITTHSDIPDQFKLVHTAVYAMKLVQQLKKKCDQEELDIIKQTYTNDQTIKSLGYNLGSSKQSLQQINKLITPFGYMITREQTSKDRKGTRIYSYEIEECKSKLKINFVNE